MTAKKRVGRDGFTGSPITVWCPTCGDWTVEKGTRCLWCEQTTERTPAQRAAVTRSPKAELRRLALERQAVVEARVHRMAGEGHSLRAIGQAVGLSHNSVRRRLTQAAA
jgi:DNA-directed RNA polymerase sigma subunit (sigma70/sigma32)